MSKQNNGGPAFPHPGGSMDAAVQESHLGMSLRDYFAAKAMHALLRGDGTTHFENRAREAYEMADAMLKARSA